MESTIHSIENKGRNYRVRLSFPNDNKPTVVSSMSFIELVNSLNGKYYLDKELNSSLSKIKVSKYNSDIIKQIEVDKSIGRCIVL